MPMPQGEKMPDKPTHNLNSCNMALLQDPAAVNITRLAALMGCWIILFCSHSWAQQSLQEYIYLDDRLIAVEEQTAQNPMPTLTSISPNSATAGGTAFSLTATGANFAPGAVVRWNGSDRTTTYLSTTQLTASITAADIASGGIVTVTVFNPTPGGGISGGQSFTINNPAPTLTSISPNSRTAGGFPFTLTATGTNYVSGSVVRWNGSNRTTTYVSATKLKASITAADIASGGTATVTVFSTTPGGGTSGGRSFTINNPIPTLTSISPSSATAGGAAFTLTATGTNYVPSSVVQWNGSNRTTTYVSATQLTASITAADIASAGTATVTVFNATPGGGTSGSMVFNISAYAQPISMTFSSSSGFAGIDCYTATVIHGEYMTVDVLYDYSPWGTTSTYTDLIGTIGPMNGQGQQIRCLNQSDSPGLYVIKAIKNNTGGSWIGIIAVNFTIRPPKPTCFDVTPTTLQLPGTQSVYACNEQNQTILVEAGNPSPPGGIFQYPLTLDSTGHWSTTVGCGVLTGTYSFIRVRNQLDSNSDAWLGLSGKTQTLLPCP
jgi:hypothetical protein